MTVIENGKRKSNFGLEGKKVRFLFSSSVDLEEGKRKEYPLHHWWGRSYWTPTNGVREESSSPLQDEGQDGRTERRVVPELLQVAAVLPFGPHSHLDETHQGEESHRQALGHQSEPKPGAQLRQSTTA